MNNKIQHEIKSNKRDIKYKQWMREEQTMT